MNLTLLLRTTSHHLTWFPGTRFPDAIPLVFVTGYPKSGTTWACQMVADYLRLPFPRFTLLPVGCPAAVQGHQRVWKRYRKGVYVLRDGRDVPREPVFLPRPPRPGRPPESIHEQRSVSRHRGRPADRFTTSR